ncbi:MAG: hypothetical protein A2161_15280 [Candidatus Schekmanbacteria bacterium RBG_13_48_7]|uniref:Uncharacterized protein n=1 Tax=Candidatus Schekmanbacteria bacterium RBG_13_48_7 TaxID=1817878 RepID=A0A1F7RMC3_9BACT|nr:MAG: hypothetical protein A2161_15280 [Candidatus Schekmanbacteria bacterium RBG_13_48_7]
MKAMILAAGLGTRMKPFTDRYPKPILPILNIPVIYYVISILHKAGISEIMINLHHLPDTIKSCINSLDKMDAEFNFSYEENILGTGGGLWSVQKFFSDETFVLINSDIVIDIDLNMVIETHKHADALATMVLRKDPRARQYGSIGLNRENKVRRILDCNPENSNPETETMFTGVHILEPSVFSQFPQQVSTFDIIRQVYIPMLKQDEHIQGYIHEGFWADIGTPQRYLETNIKLLKYSITEKTGITELACKLLARMNSRGTGDYKIVSPVLYDDKCEFGSGCKIGPNVIIGKNSAIGEKSVVENSVIFHNTIIPARSSFSNCIICNDEIFCIS